MSRDIAMPEWLPEFLQHYNRPEMPSLKMAWETFKLGFSAPERAPSYWQVRRAVRQFEMLMGGR